MDALQGAMVAAAYISEVSGRSFVRICTERGVHQEDVDPGIARLVENGLIELDSNALTRLGRDSIRVVLAGGVFDIIHPGHIHTLNAAKRLGDVLVVVVATDETAQKMKKRLPLHSQEQRRTLVESLRMVDLCVVGHRDDMFKTVGTIRPDIVALGYDQVHQEKHIADGCRKINPRIQVARLQSPVPDISSSKIEAEYGESIHGI